jgi:serine phosphatase RsbU (regulator of sigma subunit)/PAS domain-containing protein
VAARATSRRVGTGWPVAVALTVIVVVATADVVAADEAVLVGLQIAAVLLCGLTSSPAITRAVGLLAVGVAALSFLWNDNATEWTFWVPLTVVTLASLFAWRMATYRDRLARADRDLQAMFGSVTVAVMVRDASGRLKYANQAAADLLRMPDVEAVKAASSRDLMDRFEVYTEDGRPVSLEELPGTRVLRGEMSPEPMLVRNIVKATGEERWLLNTAHGIARDHGEPLLAVNVIEELTQTKRAELVQRLLAEAAQHDAAEPDVDTMLTAIAKAAVPAFADWAGADLVEPGGQIRTVAIAHLDPDKVRLGWRLRGEWPAGRDRGAVSDVIRSGRPQLVEEVTDDMLEQAAMSAEHLQVLRDVGLNSTMIVPLMAGSEILGALSFVSSTARRFNPRDLELACDLGRQIGIAVKNAQLNEDRARIAQTLQASLLPDKLPRVPGWRISSVYRAAGLQNIVGGDFYDFVMFEGGWAVVIGDVVGKGAPAAALTALVRHTTTTMLEATGDPVASLALLNRRLCERGTETMMLCTVAVVAIEGDRAIVSSAGHPLPLLQRDGQVRAVGRSSPLLGVYADGVYSSTAVEVRPGDRLLLYTDGVTDALGTRERFGEQRLVAAFGDVDGEVRDVAAEVLRAVDGFRAAVQVDDIAMVGLEREQPLPLPEPEQAAA